MSGPGWTRFAPSTRLRGSVLLLVVLWGTGVVAAPALAAGATLELTPSAAAAGQPTSAVVSGFQDCLQTDAVPGTVIVTWDTVAVGRASLFEGQATVPVTVPADAGPGDHEVQATCAENPKLAVVAGFTVLAPTVPSSLPTTAPATPTTQPQPSVAGSPAGAGNQTTAAPAGSPAALVSDLQGTPASSSSPLPRGLGLAALLLTLVAAMLLGRHQVHRRHERRWVDQHVDVRGRDRRSEADHRVRPDSDQPDVSIRLQPRPDAGTQTLEEVQR